MGKKKSKTSLNEIKQQIKDLQPKTKLEELESYNRPSLPVHKRQQANSLLFLFFFSSLMFSLPFGIFFGVRHLLTEVYIVDQFIRTCCEAGGAVLTVNILIILYAYKAYNEKEYDDEGKEIDQSLNLVEEVEETVNKKKN